MADDTRRRLARLAKNLAPDLQQAFMAAIRDLKSDIQVEMLARAIARGDVQEALAILQIRDETFEALREGYRNAFIQGGLYQLAAVPPEVKDPASGAQLVVRFGGNQPRAAEIIANEGGRLITEISESVRDMVQEVIADAADAGQGPKVTALEIAGRVGPTGRRSGGLVGLTSRDALTAQKYKRGLLAGDVDVMRDYLNLKSRNRSLDGVVRRAIENGTSLSRADVERRITAMQNKMLRRRGETIARTETIGALNKGRDEGIQQLIDRGVISVDQVIGVWDATGDSRTRIDHMKMEEQERRWGEPFTAPDGSQLMHPGDNSLGAAADQVIGCRCYKENRVDWLRGVR